MATRKDGYIVRDRRSDLARGTPDLLLLVAHDAGRTVKKRTEDCRCLVDLRDANGRSPFVRFAR
jgi:hypothetical protein